MELRVQYENQKRAAYASLSAQNQAANSQIASYKNRAAEDQASADQTQGQINADQRTLNDDTNGINEEAQQQEDYNAEVTRQAQEIQQAQEDAASEESALSADRQSQSTTTQDLATGKR